MGLDVTMILNSSIKFRYKNIFQHIQKAIRKVLDGDDRYKAELKSRCIADGLIRKIGKEDPFDLCLVLRSDFFHDDVLKFIKGRCELMISYHYDGLHRNPAIYDKIPYFDKFYVFDEADVVTGPDYSTYLSHNFYFDYEGDTKPPIYDVYFLGLYAKSREKFLLDFYRVAKELFNNPKFEIVFLPSQLEEASKYRMEGISCLTEVIPFEQYLKKIEQTDIIVDFLIGEHKGLSFRIFEGLKYGKKVITTNPEIVKYDFYHENNFFVLTENNLDARWITAFLESPYIPIEPEIVQRYSFTGWATNILELDRF